MMTVFLFSVNCPFKNVMLKNESVTFDGWNYSRKLFDASVQQQITL